MVGGVIHHVRSNNFLFLGLVHCRVEHDRFVAVLLWPPVGQHTGVDRSHIVVHHRMVRVLVQRVVLVW
jgi:hypothetical protein